MRSYRWLSLAALAGLPASSEASYWRCSQTLILLFQFSFTRINVHLQIGNISIYWLWLLLDVSAVSVVIVIIAICDMPRQEFSLCDYVYIHNTYM